MALDNDFQNIVGGIIGGMVGGSMKTRSKILTVTWPKYSLYFVLYLNKKSAQAAFWKVSSNY